MNLFHLRPSIAYSTFAASLLVLVVCALGCSKSNPATTNAPTAPQAPAIEDAATQPTEDSGATSRAVADSDAGNATNASLATFSPEQAAAWLSTYNQKRQSQQSALQLALSKLDPSLGTAEYQNALGRLAKSYPKAESADALKRVAIEAPLWESVDDWTALLRQVQGDSIASLSPIDARKLTITARDLTEGRPVKRYAEAIAVASPQIRSIASRIDTAGEYRTDSLLNTVLDRRIYYDVNLLTSDDRHYYVVRDPESLPGERLKIHFIVGESPLVEDSVILPRNSVQIRGRPRHCVIAEYMRDTLRKQRKNLLTTDWEPVFTRFLDGLVVEINLQEPTINPMPVLMIYRETLRVACEGSDRIRLASLEHQEVLDAELPNLPDTAPWYHPTDRDGEDARNLAAKIIQKLQRLDSVSSGVAAAIGSAKKGLPPLVERVAYVGPADAGEPTVAGVNQLKDGKLYVVVLIENRDKNNTLVAELIHVGDYANGKAKWKESEKEWLIEGRPLFLESGPSTAR